VSTRDLIRAASSSDDVERARELFVEYAAWLDVDLCFQNFEQELATLPGAYAPPRGRLLLAGPIEHPVGCVALRPLPGSSDERVVAEMKRLYVRPAGRGAGVGRALVEALIDEARSIGYREIKLDTLPQMASARLLYDALGFRACEAYYRNPLKGTVYMSLALG
jgi:GNAT superfamily N-acetyltransferase